MTTMYLLTTGEYSDYRVLGVYSTPELAERAKALYDADNIDELVLDAMPECPPGLLPYCVVMLVRGKVEYVCRKAAPLSKNDVTLSSVYWSSVGENAMSSCVYAEDEKHAIKIMNERRVQAIASGEWKTK